MGSGEWWLSGMLYVCVWLLLAINRAMEFYGFGSHGHTFLVTVHQKPGWWTNLKQILPPGTKKRKYEINKSEDPPVVRLEIGFSFFFLFFYFYFNFFFLIFFFNFFFNFFF